MTVASALSCELVRMRPTIRGVVQGTGFRPFVRFSTLEALPYDRPHTTLRRCATPAAPSTSPRMTAAWRWARLRWLGIL